MAVEVVRSRFPRAWLWSLLALASVVAISPELGALGRQIAYAATALVSAVAVEIGVRRNRPARPLGWRLISAALLFSFAANLAWAIQIATSTSLPGLSIIDLTYFLLYPMVAAGFVVLSAPRPGRSGLRGMTDAAVVGCTGVVLSWVLLYDPLINDSDTWTDVPGVVGYPVFDVVVLAMTVRMLTMRRRPGRTHLALAAAALVLTLADVFYFVAVAGGATWAGTEISAAFWIAALGMFGVISLAGDRTRPMTGADRPSTRRTIALYITLVLLGPAATIASLLTQRAPGELDLHDFVLPLCATAIIAVLLVLRMAQAGRATERTAATLRTALGEQATLQESLQHAALHDGLTGLPNRRSLEERLTGVAADGRPGALILLDLDGFKDVNDRLGHSAGDDLLLAVADRIRHLLGPDDLLCRPGGDEFGILLSGVPAGAAPARTEALLATLRRPVSIGGHALHVTGSAGIRTWDAGVPATDLLGDAVLPATDLLGDADLPATDLLGDADLALYAAKAAGKDCAVEYDSRLRTEQEDRVRLVERLRSAIASDEFAVHYQPIVDLRTGAPIAVEALVRWIPPGRAMIGPDRFIPAAEDSGLIVRLGEIVLREACSVAAGWHLVHGTTISVNVSPRQLTDPEFTAKVHRALDDSGLPATALTLEITEGVLVRSGAHAEQALAHLNALRAAGVRVAIDDFGTGYSSLSYLRDLPIDVLKIDKSFMPAGRDDHRQVALVRAVVDLARTLDMATVAEGVESAEHADLLRELGCDRGQGYLFARPAPARDVTRFLAAADLSPAIA